MKNLYNFIKWWWSDHLKSDANRILAGFFTWILFYSLFLILSFIFKTGIIIAIFVIATIVAIVIFGIYQSVVYFRNRYFEWQKIQENE